MCPRCCANSVFATGSRPWSSPTTWGSCGRAHPEVGPETSYARPMAGPPADRSVPVMATIEIQGLSKRFGKVRAVDDLSFTVEHGRVTGFLGPNGAGKSTTLRMLLG